jgi:hypothetical protein
LPQIFASANEDFVSVAVEGVLEMVRGESSVDLDALQRVAVSCGTTILVSPHDVKRVVRTIVRGWWRHFGYKAALSAAEAKLHQVCCYMCYF